jgi:hypothetical protein
MFAGIHISGPNAAKTAFVGLKGRFSVATLEVFCVYDRIGSTARKLSDERVIEIIGSHGPFEEIFIDCPLSVPPCVSCPRPQCPGVIACEDMSVAYMHSLAEKSKKDKKFFNPQTLRLWDSLFWQRRDELKIEPTYSPNMAPLVTRARVLQKRIAAEGWGVNLQETSVAYALGEMERTLRISESLPRDYRNFEIGRRRREQILQTMAERSWIAPWTDHESFERIAANVETFQAYVTAFVAAVSHEGFYQVRPSSMPALEGWVYLPILK